MKKLNIEELNNSFREIKRKLQFELDESNLIGQVTSLSMEISALKKEKDYLENAKKLYETIYLNYSANLDKKTLSSLPFKIRDIDENIKDILKQIIYKSQKLDSYELLLDFISYDSFSKIMEIRTPKK